MAKRRDRACACNQRDAGQSGAIVVVPGKIDDPATAIGQVKIVDAGRDGGLNQDGTAFLERPGGIDDKVVMGEVARVCSFAVHWPHRTTPDPSAQLLERFAAAPGERKSDIRFQCQPFRQA